MLRSELLRRIATVMTLGAIGIVLVLPVVYIHATGFNDNVAKGADIIMKDLRWPHWDEGTYYCQWYVNFFPDRHCTFYGGVATHGPNRRPGMFTTYWKVTKTVHEGEYFFGKGYGAEGARGGAGGAPPFLRPGSWFRFVMRVFPPTRGADKKTYVGYWVKDVEKNEWHTHSILSIAARATGFAGNSGFVEALARSAHRVFDRRLGYYRLNGKWQKSYVSSGATHLFELIEQGTAVRFDSNLNAGKKDSPFVTKQPDRPPMNELVIERGEASAWKNQVIVKWSVPGSSPPQLGYEIEVFAKRGARGAPLKVFEDAAPHIFVKRLDVGRPPKSVRLTVTDIFDQKKSITIPVRKVTPVPAAKAPGLRPGLGYAYYEAPEGTGFERLPDLPALKPARQGGVNALDVSVQRGRKRPYALRYAGYLRAPAGGLYVFSLGTCDGSRLNIDGELVGDNDGVHSRSEKQYAAALDEGLHTFELFYFRSSPRSMINQLTVLWEGPGFERRPLADDDFTREATPDAPSIRLTPASREDILKDNLVEIRPEIEARGRAIARVEYFCGKLLLNSVSEEPYLFSKVLPQGENRVMARLWYDDDHSVDSNVLDLDVRNVTGPWQFAASGEKGLPLGFRGKADQVSFVGEGSGCAYQTVSGDFTLTARIADISLTRETGTNKLNWLGLYMTEPEVRLVQTAGVGTRGKQNYRDLAGTHMAIPRFTEGRWLRLVRRGRRSQSFASVDGKTWTKTEELVGGPPKEARVGFVFRVIPRAGEGVFHGLLDHVKLERGRVPEEVREGPRTEDLSLDDRVTALVQARGNPEILYARSTTRGLLKSTDRGRTWRAVNAGLTSPDALAVRSVAVHPGDGSVVLRGGGGVVGGRLKSGLWKSADGGRSWRLITRDIDFDGRGPTTIFGEVIAFSPDDPKVVAAGGETRGLFVSEDAGETWKYVGLEGERITCLAFRQAGRKKETELAVGTFADSEFEALGLGRPAASSVGAPGRVYRCGKLGANPKVSIDMGDSVGVTRLGSYYFTTTRGVYYRDRWGLRQPLYRLPADVLYTAIGSGAGGTYAAPFSEEQHRIYRANHRWLWSIVGDDEEQNRITTWLRAGDPKEVPTMWNGYVCREPRQDEFLAPGLDVGGISCVWPDNKEEDTLFVCNRDGILKSTDHGKSYRLVYRCSPER